MEGRSPTIQDWYNALTKIAKLERVIYSNTDSVSKYDKIWAPVLSFVMT